MFKTEKHVDTPEEFGAFNPEFARKVWAKRREEADAKRAAEKEAARAALVKMDEERRNRRRLAAIMARQALQDTESRQSAVEIIRNVAVAHGFRPCDILGDGKTRPLVVARYEAIHRVADAWPHLSLPAIGRIFRRDHTTILHALRKAGVNRSEAA
jgi:chromosomal replication initiator protein